MTKNSIFFLFALAAFAVSSCNKESLEGDSDPISFEPGTTIYGRVYSSDGPLRNVMVSDGEICVQTDADGVYQLKSTRRNGLVFISVPAYYAPERDALSSRPKFWQSLEWVLKDKSGPLAEDKPERHDFHLLKDSDQDSHTRLVFGDIHVYSNGSASHFSSAFLPKVRDDVKAGVYKTPYGLTLGDMSWDWFWYENGYRNTHYLAQMDKIDFPVYGTVGNHDHDMKYNGMWFNSRKELEDTGEDWTVMIPYRKHQGPTCYSTNIGKIHYISMDDALTIDDGSGTKDGRGCILGFNDIDYEWLKQDLKYVNPSKPIILTVHMPFSDISHKSMRTPYGSLEHFSGKNLNYMFEPFKDRNILLVFSAHTHTLYRNHNVLSNGVAFDEITNGAVCGYFWCNDASRKANLTICNDGTPAGYRVLRINGTKIEESTYMAMEKKGFYPFRSYDRNNIEISGDKWSGESLASGMYLPDKNNYVYINIFDWTEGWKLTVTEDGEALNVETIEGTIYDPLALEMADKGILGSLSRLGHPLFRVKASSASSTLTITAKDPYGKSATEVMTRPKAFNWNAYAKEDYSKK